MFENPRRGRQAKTFTTTVPKILDQIVFRTDIFRKLPLGAPGYCCNGAKLFDADLESGESHIG